MKSLSTLFVLLSLGGVRAFAPPSSKRRDTLTVVNMGGFLDGRVPKNDIMQEEDDAMWIDDGSDKQSGGGGGWNPFAIAKSLDSPKKKAAPAKAAAKKAPPPPPPKKAGGFKMPWDK